MQLYIFLYVCNYISQKRFRKTVELYSVSLSLYNTDNRENPDFWSGLGPKLWSLFANQLPDLGYSSKHPHLVVWKVANWNLSKSSTCAYQCWTVLATFKELSVLLVWKKIQNQRTASSSYFKTLNGRMVLWLVFWLFENFQNDRYMPRPFIWKSWEPKGKWIYTWVDNQWVSVPHSKNCPTLVHVTYCMPTNVDMDICSGQIIYSDFHKDSERKWLLLIGQS